MYFQYQHKSAPAQLEKGTAQWFRLANSARIFINLCWYYITWSDINNNGIVIRNNADILYAH